MVSGPHKSPGTSTSGKNGLQGAAPAAAVPAAVEQGAAWADRAPAAPGLAAAPVAVAVEARDAVVETALPVAEAMSGDAAP